MSGCELFAGGGRVKIGVTRLFASTNLRIHRRSQRGSQRTKTASSAYFWALGVGVAAESRQNFFALSFELPCHTALQPLLGRGDGLSDDRVHGGLGQRFDLRLFVFGLLVLTVAIIIVTVCAEIVFAARGSFRGALWRRRPQVFAGPSAPSPVTSAAAALFSPAG